MAPGSVRITIDRIGTGTTGDKISERRTSQAIFGNGIVDIVGHVGPSGTKWAVMVGHDITREGSDYNAGKGKCFHGDDFHK